MKVIGIDTGGTFTDVITLDIETGVMQAAKALTVRGDESKGIKACLKELNISIQEIVESFDPKDNRQDIISSIENISGRGG